MARQWPLPKGSFTISSRFAGRINPVTGAVESHSGTDFAVPDGTPFYACAGGTVQYIGPADGYGQWIVIDHPDSEGGGCSEYGHMWNAFATGLKVGSKVTAGQKIGYVGSNGQSTGPHLHLTVWERGYGGKRIDPETWLAGKPYPGGTSSTGESTVATAPYTVDWSPKFNFGGPRSTSKLQGVCIHTTENSFGTAADNVANYQINSQSGSYHVLADTTGKLLRENTDDWITWSTGNKGNDVLLHLSFVAYSASTRAQWLAQEKMLRAGAKYVAYWCKLYGFPVTQLNGSDLTAGKKGITSHNATRVWGSTDHTDPGPNFPWDVFLRYVNEVLNPPKATPAAPTEEEEMANAFTEQKYKSLIDPKKSFTGSELLQLVDASTFRTEQAIKELQKQQAEILKLLQEK